MSKAPAIPKRACVVTVGYMQLLMPADDGMRLVGLLQNAVQAGQHFGPRECFFYPKEPPTVSLEMVRPGQLKAAPPAADDDAPPRRQLALAGSAP